MKAKINRALRSKPALWTGVATGVGLALGLWGRMARRRRRRLPAVLVIQAV